MMPVPERNPGENEKDFISRCIAILKKSDPDKTPEEISGMCYTQFRASAPETHDINDRELIAVGTWDTMDGVLTVDEKLIDAVMESYNEIQKTGLRGIPIKLGHDDDQKLLQKDGYPTAGWVENLRKKTRDGVLRIVGDLKTIPSKVHTIIQNRGFVNVSPELSKNFTYLNTGKKYGWLFDKLALLGIDQPAQDLDGLVKQYAKASSATTTIDFRMSEPVVTDGLPKTEPQPKEGIMPTALEEKLGNEVKELKAKSKEHDVKEKEQEDKNAELQKSLDEANEKVVATEKEKKDAAIVALIDGAIKDGKILPVQKEAYVQILSAMPEEKTYKFSDDGKEKEGNALDLFNSIIGTLPDVVKFAEMSEQKAKITKDETEEDGTEVEDVELAAKMNKVIKEEKVDQETAFELLKERGEV